MLKIDKQASSRICETSISFPNISNYINSTGLFITLLRIYHDSINLRFEWTFQYIFMKNIFRLNEKA